MNQLNPQAERFSLHVCVYMCSYTEEEGLTEAERRLEKVPWQEGEKETVTQRFFFTTIENSAARTSISRNNEVTYEGIISIV